MPGDIENRSWYKFCEATIHFQGEASRTSKECGDSCPPMLQSGTLGVAGTKKTGRISARFCNHHYYRFCLKS
jgi:hypothetical protein